MWTSFSTGGAVSGVVGQRTCLFYEFIATQYVFLKQEQVHECILGTSDGRGLEER